MLAILEDFCEFERQTGHISRYSIPQHTSAYLSIPQQKHTSAYLSIPQHTSAYLSIPQHMSQHTAC
jgi:hypothetical protein